LFRRVSTHALKGRAVLREGEEGREREKRRERKKTSLVVKSANQAFPGEARK